MTHHPLHEFRRSLGELDAVAQENIERARVIQDRIRWLRDHVDGDGVLADAVRSERPPRLVELITQNIEALQAMGVQVRATEARALLDEGLTITEIAGLFGVTRQRVSALLRQSSVT